VKLAIYARCSTGSQDLEPQLLALRAYASGRDAETPPREFLDHAVSGRRSSRPGLDALRAAARRREFGALAVVRLDRLARSLQDLLTLVAELDALGVRLVVLDGPGAMDTATPQGKLVVSVLGAMAEFEAALARERTLAGLRAARARGATFGRPPVMDARTAARCRRLAKSGYSLREIADRVGVSRMTVQRVLRGVSRAKATTS
jgi:DNA invertase Pin-like site-specific DNA recombinase